jgi:HD-GYP domain-containing protein (c-di-GMP phosphodiesterase class II)
MKTKNDNIVNSFYKRAIFALIFISLFSSLFTYYFQQYIFYTSLADEIQLNVDKKLVKYNQNLKLSDIAMLEEDVKSIMKQIGLVVIEIYDNKKEKFFTVTTSSKKFEDKLNLISKHYNLFTHKFPISKKMKYSFVKISDKQHFLQIFYPIYKADKLLGYIEGISYVEPIVINRFKRGIFTTITIVILTIAIFSLLIFPLIYFAYKKLNAHKLELLSSNIMTINTLGNTIALRDSDTNEHNYRVTLYSIKFAQSIDLEPESIKMLIKGAFLHDVGKIGISDNILLKNGSLNKEEGVELISKDSWLEDAKDVILYHHEKYDGSGYPNNVQGENIPIIARIFTIVDVFDALTSKRPYKEPYDYEKSINILKEGNNKHFDGELLTLFIKISGELYRYTRLKQKEELKKELDDLIKKYFLE